MCPYRNQLKLSDTQDFSQIEKIQLDLFNNALIFLKKTIEIDSLQLLKLSLHRKMKNKKIKDFLFIKPQRKKKKRRKESSYCQKKITDFLNNFQERDYLNSLRAFTKTLLKNKGRNIQLSLFNEIVIEKINTLQYRGNKTQISSFLKPYFKMGASVLDLMAGSQSIGLSLKKQSSIVSNDVQYYSYVLGKAYIENNKYSSLNIIAPELIKADPEFNLFQNYYSDVYFSQKQCIEIDNIRATIEKIKEIDEILYFCYLACLLQSLDMIASTAGHFDGSLDINNEKAKRRKKKSLYTEFCKRIRNFKIIKSNFKNKCYNLPAKELLIKIPEVDIIYIDPPYNHRQYSRYYHVLETCAKYDDNININTKGLYPNDEFKSDFCYKDKVEEAFRHILKLSVKKAKKKILISYTNIGIISTEKLLEICREFDLNVKLIKKKIKYTRQKTSNSEKSEKELLFILSIEGQSWTNEFLPNNRKTLVLTSCSKKKDITKGKLESSKRYIGQMFNMTKQFVNNNNYDLLIISAKYGLLKPDEKIENYELRLQNQKQSIQLRPKVVPKLKKILEKEHYDRIIIIMGKIYRTVIEELIDEKFIFLESKNGIFDYLSKLKILNDFA